MKRVKVLLFFGFLLFLAVLGLIAWSSQRMLLGADQANPYAPTKEERRTVAGLWSLTLRRISQESLTVSGEVLDKDGKSVGDAQVTIKVWSGRLSFPRLILYRRESDLTVKSDASGKFSQKISFRTPLAAIASFAQKDGFYSALKQSPPIIAGQGKEVFFRLILGSSGSTEQPSGKLTLTLTLPKDNFSGGEKIKATLTLKNDTGQSVDLKFTSSQRYDFQVVSNPCPEGQICASPEKIVWKWSGDKVFAQILETVSLKNGEQLVYSVEWDQKDSSGKQVNPGTYRLEGWITEPSLESTVQKATITIK